MGRRCANDHLNSFDGPCDIPPPSVGRRRIRARPSSVAFLRVGWAGYHRLMSYLDDDVKAQKSSNRQPRYVAVVYVTCML
jgi:hypothetical protein